ncbi:MAG: hypothetical protein AAFY91_10860, partial [Bacteroidota bacterium]
MRFRLILAICVGLFVLPQVARSQVTVTTDVEWAPICMVDSLANGDIVRFTRIINLVTLESLDIDPVAGGLYTVAGTVLTCETWDLLQIRDPLDDLYDNCQCIYTITQEGHRVIDIRGGATQEYDVEFQEVVRRRCAGQETGVVVHRDTLIETGDITTSWSTSQTLSFNTSGQFVDDFNVIVWTSVGTQTTLTVDLNPATVQASYPSLTLDPADFEYDGTNAVAMAAAYQTVFQFAVQDQAGGATTNTITCFESFGTSVVVRTNLLHDPNFPYVLVPTNDLSEYLIIASSGVSITQGTGAASLATRTNDYTEQCETIFTREVEVYLRFSSATPLNLQPNLDPQPAIQTAASNPTAFCDVSPAICAEFIDPPQVIDGCIEVCSDVLNVAGQLSANASTVILEADTYNSVSI